MRLARWSVPVLTLALLTGAWNYMNGVHALPREYVEIFSRPANEVTARFQNHPLALSNVELVRQDISDSTFENARFTNTVWEDSRAIETTFVDTAFVGGRIHATGFGKSTHRNVLFEDVTLDNVSFNQARMQNVTFRNCRITNSRFYGVQASGLVIEDSELRDVGFYDATVDLRLRKTRIVEAGLFRGLKEGSTVEIDHSYIGIYSDLSYSSLASLVIRNSQATRSRANESRILEVRYENSDAQLPVADSVLGNVSYTGSGDAIIGGSVVESVLVQRCIPGHDIHIDELKGGPVRIRDCAPAEIYGPDFGARSLYLANVEVETLDLRRLHTEELKFHNVRVRKRLDLTDARAEAFLIHNLQVDEGATVLTEGSNIELAP